MLVSQRKERPLLEEFQVQLQLGVLVEKIRSASTKADRYKMLFQCENQLKDRLVRGMIPFKASEAGKFWGRITATGQLDHWIGIETTVGFSWRDDHYL